MEKIAEFYDFEIYMDNSFNGEPKVTVNYIDEDVIGNIDIETGKVEGGFSKYVLPVLIEWYDEHRDLLLKMWNSHSIEILPAWGE